MIRHVAFVAVLAMSAVPAWQAARAQGQEPGAMAGSSYLPSTHTKGCSGIICDGNDPERAPGAAAPPACQGLICGMTPYSMSRPVTAAEAQRIQQEQARVPAAPVAATEPSTKPKRSARRKKAVKTAAARTPDPTSAAPAPAAR